MKHNDDHMPPPTREQTETRPESERLPYAPARLERLGEWSALTLQQSIPIFP